MAPMRVESGRVMQFFCVRCDNPCPFTLGKIQNRWGEWAVCNMDCTCLQTATVKCGKNKRLLGLLSAAPCHFFLPVHCFQPNCNMSAALALLGKGLEEVLPKSC